jgi:hypothetical protein
LEKKPEIATFARAQQKSMVVQADLASKPVHGLVCLMLRTIKPLPRRPCTNPDAWT